MNIHNPEINALITLLTDPDEVVYSHVSNKIHEYGIVMLPHLQSIKTNEIEEPQVVTRVQQLIHSLQVVALCNELQTWKNNPERTLLHGLYIISKYHNPTLDYNLVQHKAEKIRRLVWIELNNYQTSFEKLYVINNIFFKQLQLTGETLDYNKPASFSITNLLDTAKGNQVAFVQLYTVIAQLLDINIVPIKLPRQLILAYCSNMPNDNTINHHKQLKYFIDPLLGKIFTFEDLLVYFKTINVEPQVSYFKPINNIVLVATILNYTINCYDKVTQSEHVLALQKMLTVVS